MNTWHRGRRPLHRRSISRTIVNMGRRRSAELVIGIRHGFRHGAARWAAVPVVVAMLPVVAVPMVASAAPVRRSTTTVRRTPPTTKRAPVTTRTSTSKRVPVTHVTTVPATDPPPTTPPATVQQQGAMVRASVTTATADGATSDCDTYTRTATTATTTTTTTKPPTAASTTTVGPITDPHPGLPGPNVAETGPRSAESGPIGVIPGGQNVELVGGMWTVTSGVSTVTARVTSPKARVTLRWWLYRPGQRAPTDEYIVVNGCTATFHASASIGTATQVSAYVMAAENGESAPYFEGFRGTIRIPIYDPRNMPSGDPNCTGTVLVNIGVPIFTVTFGNAGTWLAFGATSARLVGVPRGTYTVNINGTGGPSAFRVDCTDRNYILAK